MPTPPTMRAVILKETGEPSKVLSVTPDAPTPARAPGEILVRVVASAVNPVEYKTVRGLLPAAVPKILAGDVAGVVVESDEGSPFPPGTKVFAMTQGFKWDHDGHGCWAEFVSFPESWAAVAPTSIPLADAAALPLVALTAYQTLELAPNLKAGSKKDRPRVLVHAGAGGVGHVGVQLARALYGASVSATAGPANQEFLASALGVDEPIDYTAAGWTAAHAGAFDAILDVVGGAAGEDSAPSLLAPGGSYCHVFASNTSPDKTAEVKAALEAEGKHYLGPTLVAPDGPALKAIAALVDAGQLKPVIAKRVGLDGVAGAMKEVEAGHVRGKIVVDVAPAEAA